MNHLEVIIPISLAGIGVLPYLFSGIPFYATETAFWLQHMVRPPNPNYRH